MRMRSAPVVLTSLVLGGWLTGAAAQSTNPQQDAAATAQSGGAQNLPPGVIPQPTPEAPGTVMGVTTGELYTDNLMLAGHGQPKESSWITQIQPFIRAAMNSPRFSGVFDYALTGYLYPGHSGRNQLAQQLDAQGTLAILPQHVYLDGMAMYGREVVDNSQPVGSGTFFLDGNRANVARGTLSPYWVQDLGRVGSMSLRYTLGRVAYDRRGISGSNSTTLAGIPDVTSNGVQFSVISPKDLRWGWNLQYSGQNLNPDFGPDIHYAVAKAGTDYQLNVSTRLTADVGKEDKYLPDGSNDRLGANLWDVGVDWADARNQLNLSVGHRFYGRSFQFSWTHTAALLSTTLSYLEQPTDLNQQLLGQNAEAAIVAPVGIPSIPSLRERRVYLMKRASASANYTMPNSTLHVTLYDESRKYFTLGDVREKVANADASWTFNIGAQTTFTPLAGWQRYLTIDDQIRYRRYFQLALVHQFNPDNFASLRLRNDSSDVYSAIPTAHGYRVNVVYFAWTHLF